MILNERQYAASKLSIARFLEQIGARANASTALRDEQRQLVDAAYQSQIADIQEELAEYDALRSGAIKFDPITSTEQLRMALIRARIAKGWTQAQLAAAMDVSEQQVQKDEMNRYARVSIDRLQAIADKLGLTLAGTAQMPRHVDASALESQEPWRKPLLVMLLHGIEQRHHRAVRGHVEMQKLALLVEESLQSALSWSVFRFEPYLYGAYDPQLEDDLDFLAQYDFVRSHVRGHDGDPFGVEADRLVDIESGPKAQAWLEAFSKDEKLGSPEVKRQVANVVAGVVEAFGSAGREELLRHTYAQFDELTSRSTIKDEVSRSSSRKRTEGR